MSEKICKYTYGAWYKIGNLGAFPRAETQSRRPRILDRWKPGMGYQDIRCPEPHINRGYTACVLTSRWHNQDTVFQPENNLVVPKIQPDLPENCQMPYRINSIRRLMKLHKN